MLERLNKESAADDDEMGKLFAGHLDRTYTWLEEQKNVDVLYVNYNNLIKDPLKGSELVNVFLGTNLDVEKMAAVIDTSLYRNRCEV